MTEAVKVVWGTGTEQSELSPGLREACTWKAGSRCRALLEGSRQHGRAQ